MRLRVETKVIVEGDEITIDLTGSNPEVPTGYNVPFEGSLLVGVLLRGPHDPARRGDLPRARAAERRHLPAGEGDRAEGDDLQPELPARVLLALLPGAARRRQHDPRARRRRCPDKVTAGNSAGIHFCAYAGFDETSGEYWLYLEVNEGSYGGRYGKDAMDSVDNLMANTRNNPIEELDMRFPMRCDQYELRPEPAAPGQVARRHRHHPRATASSSTAPTRARATGRPTRRGASSAAGTGSSPRCRKNPDTPREEYLPAKVTGIPFAAGEFIEFREPNAAGYGDPLERDPALVREDVLDDFTTIELARDAYGVVFADERTLEIDAAATETLRAELRAQRDGTLADRVLPRRARPVQRAGLDRGQRGVRDRAERDAPPPLRPRRAWHRTRWPSGASARRTSRWPTSSAT